MKKIFNIVLISMMIIIPMKIEAKTINYKDYETLGISHAFIIGDYIFDLDHGYSPNLRDVMKASRSIKEGKPTTLYEITIDEGYFDITEIYSKKFSGDTNDFGSHEVSYVYRSGLFDSNKDYDVLS